MEVMSSVCVCVCMCVSQCVYVRAREIDYVYACKYLWVFVEEHICEYACT